MVVFNASKTQFLHLSTRHNLPHNYDILFENTQLKPSSVLNILVVSFSWLGDLMLLRNFFTPPKLLVLCMSVVRSCMEYTSHTSGEVPVIELFLRRRGLWLFVS